MTWRTQAACKGTDPNLFFPERGDNWTLRAARAVCFSCPVREECLQDALDTCEKYGVRGGMSERERRQLRSERRHADKYARCVVCETPFIRTYFQGPIPQIICSDACRVVRKAQRSAGVA